MGLCVAGQAKMFDRYRALFALRNKGGPESATVLTEIFRSGSALLKHEVAYVLGQMLDSKTTDALVKVRHCPDRIFPYWFCSAPWTGATSVNHFSLQSSAALLPYSCVARPFRPPRWCLGLLLSIAAASTHRIPPAFTGVN